MKKVNDFVICVGMSKRQNSVADAMARVQIEILNVYKEQKKASKSTEALVKEFQRLKRIMYGVDDT